LVTKINTDTYQFIDNISPSEFKSINGLAIDSSLVYDFTHLGFNKKFESTQYSSDDQHLYTSYAQNWYKLVKKILKESNVKLLLVREKVDGTILEFCQANSILVLKNLSHTFFRQVLDFCKSEPLVYVEDFVENNVFQCKLELVNTKILSNNYLSLQSTESNPNVDDFKLTVIFRMFLKVF